MRIVVTGRVECIGSALLRHLIDQHDHEAPVIDKLTYAGIPKSLESVQGHRRYRLSQSGTRRDLSKKRA
jgi:dTDP-glucose 4,6-dehydratase